jgi:hypothetical protein
MENGWYLVKSVRSAAWPYTGLDIISGPIKTLNQALGEKKDRDVRARYWDNGQWLKPGDLDS